MKLFCSLIRLFLLITVACALGRVVTAQESASSTETVIDTRESEVADAETWELNLLFDPPVLFGGAGVALEYRPSRWFSFYTNHQRRKRTDTRLLTLEPLGEYTKHTEDSQYLAARFYFSDFGRRSFFLGAGHKWSQSRVVYDPGLLAGVQAQREDSKSGAYFGAGYRLTGPGKWFDWVVDINVNYEPAIVDEATYIAEEFGFFGASKARLDVSYKYALSPEIRFGVRF